MKTKTITSIKKRRSEKLLPATAAYRTKVDSKRRIVLRSAQYEYYNVYERSDGSLLITPQIVTDVRLSDDTLRMLGSAVKNMKRNIVSKRIDLDAFFPKKRKQ